MIGSMRASSASDASTLALASTKNRATSVCPSWAATCNGCKSDSFVDPKHVDTRGQQRPCKNQIKMIILYNALK